MRVNAVIPGFFPAEQNRRLLFEEDGTPTLRGRQILGHTPMNRFGVPEELVGTVVFLAAGAASSFVTGTDIRVDGGFLAMAIWMGLCPPGPSAACTGFDLALEGRYSG